MLPTQFKSMQDLVNYLSTMEARLAELERENRALKEAMFEVGGRSNFTEQAGESLPKTNLLSKNFFTRALAVWGHYAVIQLIISLVLLAAYLCFVFVLIGSVVGSGNGN